MHPKDPQNMVANAGRAVWPCSPGPIATMVASGHRHLDCLDTPSTHGVEGHDCMLQVLRKLEDQPLPLPYVISGLVTTLVWNASGRWTGSEIHEYVDIVKYITEGAVKPGLPRYHKQRRATRPLFLFASRLVAQNENAKRSSSPELRIRQGNQNNNNTCAQHIGLAEAILSSSTVSSPDGQLSCTLAERSRVRTPV